MHNVRVGQHVVYVDSRGRDRDALVTAIWGQAEFEEGGAPSINVVIIDENEGAEDTYGRQRILETSVVHESYQQAHGNYWRLP